jgi:hypothetical protein
MTNRALFPQIPITTEFPQLPFNYHEPMTMVEKSWKLFRVYYTEARNTHVLIVESYDGGETYYKSFSDENFMPEGEFDKDRDNPTILSIMIEEYRVSGVSELKKKLVETVDSIFTKR